MTSTNTISRPSTTTQLPVLDAFSRHGAYPSEALREALGGDGLRAAVESGRLTGFGRGVLLDSQRLLDLRTRAAGALLLAGPDAVLVGPTAAALHGCPAMGGHAVHLRVPYYHRVRGRPGMIVHQGSVRAVEVDQVGGLPVLRLSTALAEVLCGSARRAALAAVDQALRPLPPERRPAMLADIRTALAGRPDRRGSRRARTLLDLATGRPTTAEQSALLLAMVDGGLPVPICRYDVPGTRHRLTFAWPDARVGLQHAEPDDDLRDHELRAHGWLVIRSDTDDLAEPTGLYRRLRPALNVRRRAA